MKKKELEQKVISLEDQLCQLVYKTNKFMNRIEEYMNLPKKEDIVPFKIGEWVIKNGYFYRVIEIRGEILKVITLINTHSLYHQTEVKHLNIYTTLELTKLLGDYAKKLRFKGPYIYNSASDVLSSAIEGNIYIKGIWKEEKNSDILNSKIVSIQALAKDLKDSCRCIQEYNLLLKIEQLLLTF